MLDPLKLAGPRPNSDLGPIWEPRDPKAGWGWDKAHWANQDNSGDARRVMKLPPGNWEQLRGWVGLKLLPRSPGAIARSEAV